jgi:hypothetical protein
MNLQHKLSTEKKVKLFASKSLLNSLFALTHVSGQPVFKVCRQMNLPPQNRGTEWTHRAQRNIILKRFGNYIFTVKHSNERRACKLLFNGTNHAKAELVLWAPQTSNRRLRCHRLTIRITHVSDVLPSRTGVHNDRRISTKSFWRIWFQSGQSD